MNKSTRRAKTNRLIVGLAERILLIDLCIFASVGVICWLIAARTPQHYGLGLVLAGVVCLLIGLTTVLGGSGVSMSLRVTDPPASRAPTATIHRRIDRWLTGPIGSLGFLLMMGVAGFCQWLLDG